MVKDVLVEDLVRCVGVSKCEREYYGHNHKKWTGRFPGSPIAKTPLPLQSVQVGFFINLILIGG